MTPDARMQAAIELLDLVDESNQNKGLPVDVLFRAYFRKRRYAGSKDRRAIRGLLFDVMRDWGRARWLAKQAQLAPVGRSHFIAYALANHRDLIDLFGDTGYGPQTLDASEQKAIAVMQAALEDIPVYAALNTAKDIHSALLEHYGTVIDHVVPVRTERAALTLRAYPHAGERQTLLAQIKTAGHTVRAGRYAPRALVLPDAKEQSDLPLVDQGLAEVQDEASQLCALMVSPPPGATVVDLCAGAGGKTLAMAAQHPKARFVACDVSSKKLAELGARATRAGLTNIEIVHLPAGYPAHQSAELDAIAASAHWVLVDAPCSSSGTWRRHPALRYRYTMHDVSQLAAQQLLLARAGLALLRTGGRLTFATCSILPQEGEHVLRALLEKQRDLKPICYEDLLSGCVKKMPDTLSKIKEWLLLSPPIHGCDGFFCGTVRLQP